MGPSGEFRVFIVAFGESHCESELGAFAALWVACTRTDPCSTLWPALVSAFLIPTCLIDTLADGVINNA